MMIKYHVQLIVFFICTFLSSLYCATLKANTNIYGRYADIQTNYNLDSLEKAIPKVRHNAMELVNLLICIEHNRIAINSYRIAEYLPMIDSLSNALHYPFGIAYAQFLLATSTLKKSQNIDKKLPILQFEKAAQSFASINDTMGVCMAELYLAKSYTSFIQMFNPDDSTIQNTTAALKTNEQNHFNFAKLLCTILKSDSLWITYNLIYYNTQLARLSSDIDFNYLEKNLEKALITIQNDPTLKHNYCKIYQFYASIYYIQKQYSKCILYNKLAKQSILHEETADRYALDYNISVAFHSLNQKDSSIVYNLQALESMQKMGVKENSDLYIFVCKGLAELYAYKKQKDKSIQYYDLCMDQLLYSKENLTTSLRSAQNDYDIIKEKELQNKELENKNELARQRFLLGSAILVIFLIMLAFALWQIKKLSTAKKKIEELQNTREKFYSIVSHDLFNPINSYQGLANKIGYLLKKNEYTKIEDIAKKIDDNGKKLESMLQNLLQWSRDQQNNLAYRPELVDIKQLLIEKISIYAFLAEQKSVVIKSDLQYDKPMLIDPNYLKTVLRNLFDNAIKNANTHSEMHINLFESQQKLIFSISNATNKQEEKIKDIQALFAQSAKTQPGQYGVGLGLILIKEFVGKMNGQVTAHIENQTVTFTIQLPLQ